MKKSILSLMVLAIAGLAFTGCDDVPMPYNQPNVKPDTPSEVTPQGTGTAADPYNVAKAIEVVSALEANAQTESEIYVKGAVKEIREIDPSYGNATYYITDDGKNQIYIYRSKYLGNTKFTSSDQLSEGDSVVVCGKFTNYSGNTPETVTNGSYLYSLNGKTQGGGSETGGEAKGDGTQANPYNATGANKAASALSADGKLENVYVTGIISKIKSIDTGSFGNAEYYISEDGTTNGDQFYVFRGYYTNGDKFTSKDQLKVGQKVTVLGTLVNYMGNTPEMAQGSKIVSIDGSGTTPDTPDTPGTSEGVTISGTTVTLTNSGVTAGTETATIDLNNLGLASGDKVSGPYSLSDGSTISVAQGEGKSAPVYHSATKGFRIYASNTITFNASKPIAKIVFSCDSYNGTDYVGNASQTITFSGNTAIYCNYIKGNSGGTQLRVKTITVTYAK